MAKSATKEVTCPDCYMRGDDARASCRRCSGTGLIPGVTMTPEEELDIWRRWGSVALAGWEDVEDIEAELGRTADRTSAGSMSEPKDGGSLARAILEVRGALNTMDSMPWADDDDLFTIRKSLEAAMGELQAMESSAKPRGFAWLDKNNRLHALAKTRSEADRGDGQAFWDQAFPESAPHVLVALVPVAGEGSPRV